MSIRPGRGILGLALGIIVSASALTGCGDSSTSATGEPSKPIPNVNPTPNNPNVPIDEEYKNMDKLKKGNDPAK